MSSAHVGEQSEEHDSSDFAATLPNAPAPAPARDDQRTMHAVRLFDFGELFRRRFAHQTFGAERVRRLRLTDPDSQSTGGGRAARRSLLLVPDDGSHDTLVVGWIDVVKKQAELRTFESMCQYMTTRFSRPLDLTVDEYAEMCFELVRVMKGEGIQLCLVPASLFESAPEPSVAPRSHGALFWMFGLLTGLCLGYALCST